MYKLGNPISCFGKNIICFNNNYHQIKRGDCIAGKNSKGMVTVGSIISLRIGSQEIDAITEDNSVDFGAKVDFHVHKRDSCVQS